MTCQCFAHCEADCVCNHDWTPPIVKEMREKIERLRAENEELRRYANHTNDCNLSSIYQFVALRGCNCGFDALAAKGEGE